MKASDQGTEVSILDKEFCINCPPDKEQLLKASAQYLDKQMRQIRKNGRVIGIERIAVMAALNITHELLTLKESREKPADDFSDRIKLLHDKIEDVLAKSPLKEPDSYTTKQLSTDRNFSAGEQVKTLDASTNENLIIEEETI